MLQTTNWPWIAATVAAIPLFYFVYDKLIYADVSGEVTKPISVNYHFTRKCNKTCGFCFHTEKTSFVALEVDMQRGLMLLRDAGMRKINFAGGEPFLYPKKLAMLCRFCKEQLGLESVSIITNGTLVAEGWMRAHGRWVDVLGVSCDSFNEETNMLIGRGSGENVAQLFRIRGWCQSLGVKFKLNTVVCTHNWREDMTTIVEQLDPFRWKVFQVLMVAGENDDSNTNIALDKRKRDARKLLISDEQFRAFCDRHKHVKCFVPEPNSLMASSYLILDEYLCFLDKGPGREKQSRCILDVGVQTALGEVRWDQNAFQARGGMYEWTKDTQDAEAANEGCGAANGKDLEW
ncbi:radical S-adenosyl methionine domain-containing protein 2 [Mycena vitilis]|nr:radical S-adenosyl methionine domain-containing protein 2 [Mycena vitilis]